MAAAPPPTIVALIAEGERALAGAGIGPARLEAEVLLARSLGVPRTSLILDPREAVGDAETAAYRIDITKRAARYPLQYLTGIQEFHSLDFEVDARVLIPRAETEMIVDEALRLVSTTPGAGAPLLVDVGTGSGCIAVTLAVRIPGARVFASDISEGALEVAARNAARHGVAERVRLGRGDGLAPALEAGLACMADFVVSNPPYVPEAELAGLQPELAFEPRGALTPGPDGLSFTARLVEEAARVVRPGGYLLVELGAGSAERARRLLVAPFWEGPRVEADLQGIPRLLVARRTRAEAIAPASSTR